EIFSHGEAMLKEALEGLRSMQSGSVDHIITDPPLGIPGVKVWTDKTLHEWDRPLPWDELLPEMWRVLKPNGNLIVISMNPLSGWLISRALEQYIETQ